MQRAVLVATVAVALGCGGSSAPAAVARPGRPDPSGAGAVGYATPARWDFHPGAPESVIARVRLPDGGCVLSAEGGQRWTVSPNGARGRGSAASGSSGGCVGRAAASSSLAPEDIVDIVRRSQSSWFFVGATGRIFESNDPLGPFARSIDGPEPFAKVAGAGGRLLGATLAGKLLRFEDDGGWKEAPTPSAGSGAARVFDLAIADDGRALALAFPEALFTSEDGGANWKPAGAPLVGAQRLGFTESGQLAAEGVLESVVWPTRTAPLTRSSQPVGRPRAEPEMDAGRAPSAAAVIAGRAAIDAERYFEAVRAEQEGEDWLLATGRIEGRLDARAIPGSRRCEGGKLAVAGRQVIFVCLPPPSNGVSVVELMRSADAGEHWSDAAAQRFETPGLDALSVAATPDGSALIAGVCRPGREGSCKPSAPMLVRNDASASAAPVSAPDLREVAVGPAFSVDGRSAYLLGRRSKDGLLALFVSHDGGESFMARRLDPPGSGRSARADVIGSDEGRPAPESAADADEPASSDEFDVGETTAIHPGEDGTVGINLVRPRGAVYVTTTEDGQLIEVAYPEEDGAVVAGFGRRVLAVVADRGSAAEDTEVDVRESLDGGSNWARVPQTPALAQEFLRGSSAIACGAGGCLFGDTVSRVGWAGQTEAAPAGAAAAPGDPPRARAASPRTPIVCEVPASSRYRRAEHLHPGNGGATLGGAPTLDQIARGRWLWSLLGVDRKTGEATMIGATLPEGDAGGDARPTTRVLLAKSPRGRTVAMQVSPQMEGYALARLEVALDAKGEAKAGTPMKNVEIVWENLIEGSSGRATLVEAGTLESGDVRADPVAPEYEPGLVSISPHGVYLRPHHREGRSSQTWFFDVSGRTESFSYPTWPDKTLSGDLKVHADAAFVDGKHLAVGMVQADKSGSPSTVLLAHREGATWKIGATSLAPPAAEARMLITQMDWTYSGKSLGVTTVVAEPLRGRAWAQFHPFRADGTFGPAVALPTLLDLGPRPRACSAADRAGSPRFEAALFQGDSSDDPRGVRHPVLIVQSTTAGAKGAGPDGREPTLLSTAGAVVHGTPASPCVAGWQAHDKQGRAGAVISGDLSRAFLFRPVAAAATGQQLSARAPRPEIIEYRPMSCRFDPSASVPEEM